jgi:membrane associated rhomboid family serine protease
MCAAVGLVCFLVLDPRTHMRGLSGVDAGLFAAALMVEFRLAWRDPSRWWWVAPAAALFLTKTVYETVTGQSFFNTQSLLGPMKLATTAHLAGIAAAVLFVLLVPLKIEETNDLPSTQCH